MNKPILIYGKQPSILYITEHGEILIHETESHDKKDLAITLSNLLKTKIISKDITLINNLGGVTYNDGCRRFEFKLAFIQK